MISRSHPREKLSEFIDETLAPAERERVAAHLESCAECAQTVRELRNLRATLRETAPVSAPASLRQNVRAALQNEIRAVAPKPAFVWRPAQFAWTGTLTLATLTLMILARPFSQSSLEQSPFSTSAPAQEPAHSSISTKNQSAPKTPLTGTQTINPQKMKAQPRPQNSAPDSAAPPSRAQDLASNSASSSAGAPVAIQPAPRRAASTRNRSRAVENESAQPDNSTKNEANLQSSDASVPETVIRRDGNAFAPPAPSLSRSTPPSTARPQQETAPSIEPKMPRDRNGISQDSAQSSATLETKNGQPRENRSIQNAAPNKSGLPGGVASALSGAMAPQFTLALKAVPLSVASEKPLANREAPSALALPAPITKSGVADADSTKNEESVAGQRARVARGVPGALPAPNAFRAHEDSSAFEMRTRKTENSPARAALSSESAPRRFGLQIETPRNIKGAQVRLEVPPSVRVLWPASNVIWRGDFSAGKAVTIEFSLSKGSGNEKIVVIVEQKTASAPSNRLQTQTLILPAANP